MKKKYIKPQIDTTGLAAHYKLWAGLTSAASVFDYSLNGNNGTITSAIPAYPGFSFDGTNDTITVTNPTPLDDTQSISVWVFSTEGAGSNYIRTMVGRSATGNGSNTLSLHPNNQKFAFYEADGNAVVVSQAAITASTWYHLVVTFDGTATVLYQNGLSHDTGTLDLADPFNNNSNLTIGGGYANRYFAGRIGEILLFSKTLSATEVRSIYEQSRWRYNI